MTEQVKLAPSVRVSGGTPAGFEDFVPMNPWGREMPKPTRPPRPPLYQVVVRDNRNGKKELRVGPKWARESAEMLCHEISRLIGLGLEKDWTDPVVIPMPAEIDRTIFRPGVRISL